MSVTVEASSISYDGNDVADEFAVPFKFLESDDLLVRTTDDDGATYTTLVEGTDYTVDGEGEDDGGTVTTTDPVATGTSLVITRNTDITQETDFAPQGVFPAERHELVADKLTLICQELDRRVAALEALADLVNVTEAANAAVITPETFTASDPLEDTFELLVSVAGGDSADFVVWKVVRTDNEPMTEAVEVTWSRGFGNNLFIQNITGLEPGVEYTVTGLVFFT